MPRTEHYKTLGYVHELQQEFPDPVTHFKKVVSQMNVEEKADKKGFNIHFDVFDELHNQPN